MVLVCAATTSIVYPASCCSRVARSHQQMLSPLSHVEVHTAPYKLQITISNIEVVQKKKNRMDGYIFITYYQGQLIYVVILNISQKISTIMKKIEKLAKNFGHKKNLTELSPGYKISNLNLLNFK